MCDGKHVSRATFTRHTKCDRDNFASYSKQNECYETPERFETFNSELGSTPIIDGYHLTVEEVLPHLFARFADHQGITKTCLSEDLENIHNSFEKPNNFPNSYEKAKKFIQHQLPETTTYDSCINDHVLFRKHSDRDYSLYSTCPECKEPRYNTYYVDGRRRYGTARKTIRYIHMKERLVRLFGEPNLAKLVYAKEIELNQDFLKDVHDGEAWKSWFAPDGIFGSNPNGGVPGAFSGDGLNGNRNKNIQRSFWPLQFTFLSLKSKYRNTLGVGSVLVTVVPGWEGAEPKSLQHVLERYIVKFKHD